MSLVNFFISDVSIQIFTESKLIVFSQPSDENPADKFLGIRLRIINFHIF